MIEFARARVSGKGSTVENSPGTAQGFEVLLEHVDGTALGIVNVDEANFTKAMIGDVVVLSWADK